MVFNSIFFICFFLPLVIIVYYCIKESLRNLFLVSVSLFFLAWGSVDCLKIIVLIILADFLITRGYSRTPKVKKALLLAGIILNIGILCYFKYLNFVISAINTVFQSEFRLLDLIVPLGISFIVFHSISYLVDCYRDETIGQTSLLELSLYLLYFPKLIQGPIVRFCDFSPQLQHRTVSLDTLVSGIERFVIGLGKKVLVADMVGETVTTIFSRAALGIDVPTAWLGVVFFSFQIYFDFSGYSDMAIGISKIFGFSVKENFNFPYISKSITEFWRRWHISLGSWFREYVYIPLGGNRKGNVYFNLFIVFLVTGIWHGAGSAYIVWGVTHGFCIILERFLSTKNLYKKIPAFFRWAVTLLIVWLGWVLFNTGSLSDAFVYYKQLFGFASTDYVLFSFPYFVTPRNIFLFVLSLFGSVILGKLVKPSFYEKLLTSRSLVIVALRYILICALFILCLISIISGTYSPFLYFQF